MRPRKKLLLYCADPNRAGEMAFTLRQAAYYHVTVVNNALNLASVSGSRFDAALLVQSWPGAATIVKAAQPACKVLAVGSNGALAEMQHIDNFLPNIASMAVILDTLRTMTARKRGPKKGFRYRFPQAVPTKERTA